MNDFPLSMYVTVRRVSALYETLSPPSLSASSTNKPDNCLVTRFICYSLAFFASLALGVSISLYFSLSPNIL